MRARARAKAVDATCLEKNWQFEDAERIGAVRSYGCAANGEYERAPKIDKGQWDHGH